MVIPGIVDAVAPIAPASAAASSAADDASVAGATGSSSLSARSSALYSGGTARRVVGLAMPLVMALASLARACSTIQL